jgi:pimeloyl-ACP methyl ester carboxylesterase
MSRWAILGAVILLVAAACTGNVEGEPTTSEPEPAATTITDEPAEGEPTTEPGASQQEPAATTEPERPADAAGAFEQGDCFSQADGSPPSPRMTCGFVTVPLDHGADAGPTMRLATVLVDNGSDAPPVVFLPGGPGGSAVSQASFWVGAPFDVLIFDERGVGFSEPTLDCDETDALFPDLLSRPILDFWEDWLAALQACRDRLVAEGIDLALFDSAQSARDIGAVQRALEFDEVTLLGASYGTRLALTKLRDQPAGVRAVILDSVVPLDVDLLEVGGANYQRSLDLLVSECAASPECARLGDVGERIERLTASLADEPVTVTGQRPYDGGSVEMLIDGDMLPLLVFFALYDSERIAELPFTIAAADDGDATALQPLVDHAMFFLDPALSFSDGYQASVICREEFPFNDPVVVSADVAAVPAAITLGFSHEKACAIWDTVPAPPIEDEAVISDVPALVFAGAFDPITPPSWSQLVADRLPNAVYVEIPSGGHGAVPDTACSRSILESFIADPLPDLDVSCMTDVGGPNWKTG